MIVLGVYNLVLKRGKSFTNITVEPLPIIRLTVYNNVIDIFIDPTEVMEVEETVNIED